MSEIIEVKAEEEKIWEVFAISYSKNKTRCQAVIHVKRRKGGKRSYTRHLTWDPVKKGWQGNGYGKRWNKTNTYTLAGQIVNGKITRFADAFRKPELVTEKAA